MAKCWHRHSAFVTKQGQLVLCDDVYPNYTPVTSRIPKEDYIWPCPVPFSFQRHPISNEKCQQSRVLSMPCWCKMPSTQSWDQIILQKDLSDLAHLVGCRAAFKASKYHKMHVHWSNIVHAHFYPQSGIVLSSITSQSYQGVDARH